MTSGQIRRFIYVYTNFPENGKKFSFLKMIQSEKFAEICTFTLVILFVLLNNPRPNVIDKNRVAQRLNIQK